MPEIQEKIKEKKSSEAHIRSNIKSRKKALENGKIKRFNIDSDPKTFGIIDNFCKNNNISKAEIIRKLAAKIEDGTFEI